MPSLGLKLAILLSQPLKSAGFTGVCHYVPLQQCFFASYPDDFHLVCIVNYHCMAKRMDLMRKSNTIKVLSALRTSLKGQPHPTQWVPGAAYRWGDAFFPGPQSWSCPTCPSQWSRDPRSPRHRSSCGVTPAVLGSLLRRPGRAAARPASPSASQGPALM